MNNLPNTFVCNRATTVAIAVKSMNGISGVNGRSAAFVEAFCTARKRRDTVKRDEYKREENTCVPGIRSNRAAGSARQYAQRAIVIDGFCAVMPVAGAGDLAAQKQCEH